jgi:hypothetical protein
MNSHRFFGLAVVLLAPAGCGPDKPTAPSGVVYQGKHTSEWGDAVNGPDRQERLEAAKVLVKMGKEGQNANPAIPGLRIAIQDEDPAIRGWAAVALVYAVRGTPFPIGPVAGPKLKEAAESSDEELRAEASVLLKRLESAHAGRPGPPDTKREGATGRRRKRSRPPTKAKANLRK